MYKALKCTDALTVKDALDCDEIMNLVRTGITNFFTALQEESKFHPDNPTSSIYNTTGTPPPPLIEVTPDS